jgi:CRP/FNR family transcriptional regulator, cyclic AMP receptor protein
VQWALFEGVDDQHVRELLKRARRRRFRRGESVFHEGDPGDSLHLLVSGFVAVRVTTPSGEVATLRILPSGAHFGDVAMLSTGRRSATITALEQAETMEIAGDVLADFARRHLSVERAITHTLVVQLRSLSAALLEAMYVPAPQRIARRLVELCDVYGRLEIPLTQDDLAGLSGTTRQTVNQQLMEWRQIGIVDVGRSRLIISDRAGLERAAR